MRHLASCFIAATLLVSGLSAQFEFDQLPSSGQLIPQDETGYAPLSISGSIREYGWKTISLNLYRNDEIEPFSVQRHPLPYKRNHARFLFQEKLPAALVRYRAEVVLENWQGDLLTIATRTALYAGDAYLITGQSNALAKRHYDSDPHANDLQSEWVRSFGSSSDNPYAVGGHRTWGLADGETRYTPYGVGAWAFQLGDLIRHELQTPVAFLNGAVGGSSIYRHLRDNDDPTNLDTIYGRLLWRAKESKLQSHIRTIYWYQGEADGNAPGEYSANFDKLISAWREDYPALERVYVMQVREGCGVPDGSMILENIRQLPATHSEVQVVSTTALSGYDGCHYHFSGYQKLAGRLFDLILRDVYHTASIGVEVESPTVFSAMYSSTAQDEIILLWGPKGTQLVTQPDAELDFHLSDGAKVDSLTVSGRRLILQLDRPSASLRLRYVREDLSRILLDGSWITNSNGVGALNFDISIE
ncbi:MAG: hypothetical protein HN961_10165 [Planctomycetes bacterium]|nr:hypothetical protein [Planctomycetota bacterium]